MNSFNNFQKDDIVKVGPAIDENTGKASLKSKPILDSKETRLYNDDIAQKSSGEFSGLR